MAKPWLVPVASMVTPRRLVPQRQCREVAGSLHGREHAGNGQPGIGGDFRRRSRRAATRRVASTTAS
ncbi:MAG: hypothetical protein ACRDZR_14890, partial [Acidimicrobiales bacterium]